VIRPVVAFALLAVAGFASAQESSAPPDSQHRRPREEAFRMIDAYFVSNLQESLGLTDEQFVRLLPMVRRLQNDRRQYAQRRQRALQEMRKALQSGGATEGRIEELLREVKAAEGEEAPALRRDREAIDAVLSPVQQAKFRILELEVERKIREMMAQMRGQARPLGRGRPRDQGQSPRP
jgi:hypothetical protein